MRLFAPALVQLFAHVFPGALTCGRTYIDAGIRAHDLPVWEEDFALVDVDITVLKALDLL